MIPTFKPPRATRAQTLGLVLGGSIGITLGACYVAGSMARSIDRPPSVDRLQPAAAQRFSDHALSAMVATMDPGELALAERHDPLSAAVGGLRLSLQQADAPAEQQPAKPRLIRVSYVTAPPARPFHFAAGDALQSARDLDCLTDAVYYESRGEPPAGQEAVAQVVLNRVRHPMFPKTVCGVVFQGVRGAGCQFSFACDGSMRRPRDGAAWARAEQIASKALAGSVMSKVGEATHFHVVGLNPGWGPRLLQVARIGLHVFYRFGGYAGAPSTFNGAARPSDPDAPQAAEIAQINADGHPAGQILLASTSLIAPGQTPSQIAPAGPDAKLADTPQQPPAKPDPPAKPVSSAGL